MEHLQGVGVGSSRRMPLAAAWGRRAGDGAHLCPAVALSEVASKKRSGPPSGCLEG